MSKYFAHQRSILYNARADCTGQSPLELGLSLISHLFARDYKKRTREFNIPLQKLQGSIRPPSFLPVNAKQVSSLREVLRQAPDPRDSNTHYRIGPVFTII